MEQATQAPTVSEVTKPKNRFLSRVLLGQPMTPKTVHWFVKSGLTKTERTAGALLIVLTILDFVTSILILAFVFRR